MRSSCSRRFRRELPERRLGAVQLPRRSAGTWTRSAKGQRPYGMVRDGGAVRRVRATGAGFPRPPKENTHGWHPFRLSVHD